MITDRTSQQHFIYGDYHTLMTFKQLADKIGVSILDLIPDQEQAYEVEDLQLFECNFTDGLVEEGILSKDLQKVLV